MVKGSLVSLGARNNRALLVPATSNWHRCSCHWGRGYEPSSSDRGNIGGRDDRGGVDGLGDGGEGCVVGGCKNRLSDSLDNGVRHGVSGGDGDSGNVVVGTVGVAGETVRVAVVEGIWEGLGFSLTLLD